MKNAISLPVVCILSDSEFREREQTLLKQIGSLVLERRELENGYAFQIPADDDEALRRAAEFIILERKCCPFLDFKISVKAGGAGVWLELTGEAEQAKEFIAETFK
jgi:hypothetical protein